MDGILKWKRMRPDIRVVSEEIPPGSKSTGYTKSNCVSVQHHSDLSVSEVQAEPREEHYSRALQDVHT